jgi:hypothetical protein
VGFFAAVEVSVSHAGHAGLRIRLPGPHGRRPLGNLVSIEKNADKFFIVYPQMGKSVTFVLFFSIGLFPRGFLIEIDNQQTSVCMPEHEKSD